MTTDNILTCMSCGYKTTYNYNYRCTFINIPTILEITSNTSLRCIYHSTLQYSNNDFDKLIETYGVCKQCSYFKCGTVHSYICNYYNQSLNVVMCSWCSCINFTRSKVSIPVSEDCLPRTSRLLLVPIEE